MPQDFSLPTLNFSGQATGSVARVAPVESSQQLDLAALNRVTEPVWTERPRPDIEGISFEDVTQFRHLVYDLAKPDVGSPAIPGVAGVSSETIMGPAFSAAYQDPSMAPGDRIAATLQHLRGLDCP